MQVLVQHKETGFYWGRDGSWVELKRLAMDFKTSVGALEFCARKQLKDVEILLCFNESVWDIRLQVPSHAGQTAPSPAR